MAVKKEISGFIKLQIKGGQANPAPPVGPALGQRGVNIMEFCKAFNDKTKSMAGKPVPVEITVYKDKKFDFKIKSPPASFYIKEAVKLKGGELNFEKLICTPGMMIKLSKLGKVLGPKGLMPNPKLGSVSENIKEAVTNAKSGQVEIRNDKDGNIGVSIGKKSFSDDQLLKNYNAILDALEKEKSNNTLKGDLIRSVFATSTMGVSYKVKLGKSI